MGRHTFIAEVISIPPRESNRVPLPSLALHQAGAAGVLGALPNGRENVVSDVVHATTPQQLLQLWLRLSKPQFNAVLLMPCC